MKSEIIFGDIRLQKEFDEINDSRLKKQIEKALQNLEEDASSGIQIPKRLIPNIQPIYNDVQANE